MPPVNDPIDLVENEIAKAEQAQRERQERAVQASVLQRLLSQEVGRTFVMDQLLEFAGVFRQSLNVNYSEATHLTAFADGRRSVGLHIYNLIIETCPEMWQVMIRERARRLEAKKVAS